VVTHPYDCVDFIGCFFIGRVREGNIDMILLRQNDNSIHACVGSRSRAIICL
jgi:hypothetical protein